MSAQPQTLGPVDNRALLASISHRTVRAVASEIGPFAEALLAVVLERKPRDYRWQPGEWAEVVDELDACTLTVGEFLRQEFERQVRR